MSERTFILAGNEDAAREWCRENGVRVNGKGTVFVASTRTLQGVRFSPDDLVVHLPSFDRRVDAGEIDRMLEVVAWTSGAQPRWKRVIE
ncbi:hypothetical protein [Cellulomonas sp. SG140]|uniref:hypothetical protein n=1 Tax=Cellulomonas sp. SG140 TaxID=2976536 RepID=UPI0021E927D9|nr:hypothetical protein [Cellulomonas sp. SG140]